MRVEITMNKMSLKHIKEILLVGILALLLGMALWLTILPSKSKPIPIAKVNVEYLIKEMVDDLIRSGYSNEEVKVKISESVKVYEKIIDEICKKEGVAIFSSKALLGGGEDLTDRVRDEYFRRKKK